MQLHHDFAQRLPHLVRPTEGEEQPNPEMVILNEELARQLGFDPDWLRSSEGIEVLTGRGGGARRGIFRVYRGLRRGIYPIRG